MLSIVLSKKYKCYLGGNIGLPLFNLKSKNNFKNEFVIVEASSFMLEHCNIVKPFIYVLTNVSPHHIDYHLTFENYLNAKTKLIKNIDQDGLLITPKEIETHCFSGKKIIINDSTNKIKIDSNKICYNNDVIKKEELRQWIMPEETIEESEKAIKEIEEEQPDVKDILSEENE